MHFTLSGRLSYRLLSLAAMCWISLVVSLRRLFRGPLLPHWTWSMEVGTALSRWQNEHAFAMPNIADAREFGCALTLYSGKAMPVEIRETQAPVKGKWYGPGSARPGRTVLYLHGGGYAFCPQVYEGMIPQIAAATRAPTFALDYRLAPEHPFPAQLDDALDAYKWLLETGVPPQQLVVAGDSAGGNLMLTLLLALRDSGLPLPALGIGLCPWTDLTNSGASMSENDKYDIVGKRMADRWADWYRGAADARDPQISPFYANLKGLCPLYIQAGSKEILHDMICAFADKANSQRAQVCLEVWEDMNHDFQAYGEMTRESREALKRIGEVIDERLR